MQRLLPTLLVLLAAPAAAAEPPAELMERLAAWAKRTDLQTAMEKATISTVSEELNKDGEILHTEKLVLRLTHVAEGEPMKTEIVTATRDGKDNREKAEKRQRENEQRAAEARKDGKPRGGFAGALPFAAERRELYVFEVLEPFADAPQMLRIRFSPRRRPDPEVFVGEAKVDPVSGAVLWLKEQPSKLPSLADRFQLQMFFGTPSPAGPLLSEIRMYGEGGVLMFKQRVRVTMRFTELVLRKPAS